MQENEAHEDFWSLLADLEAKCTYETASTQVGQSKKQEDVHLE